jgi:hypothetical protein
MERAGLLIAEVIVLSPLLNWIRLRFGRGLPDVAEIVELKPAIPATVQLATEHSLHE